MSKAQTIETGGPAFPYAAPEGVFHREGMTLRDWFAGQALASFQWATTEQTYSRDAEMCYQMADAMLKARNQ